MLRILGEILDHRICTESELNDIRWQEKYRLIQSDPVTCARHFDYQVQIRMNKYLLNELQPQLQTQLLHPLEIDSDENNFEEHQQIAK